MTYTKIPSYRILKATWLPEKGIHILSATKVKQDMNDYCFYTKEEWENLKENVKRLLDGRSGEILFKFDKKKIQPEVMAVSLEDSFHLKSHSIDFTCSFGQVVFQTREEDFLKAAKNEVDYQTYNKWVLPRINEIAQMMAKDGFLSGRIHVAFKPLLCIMRADGLLRSKNKSFAKTKTSERSILL